MSLYTKVVLVGDIPEEVKRRRTELGLSQQKLAKLAGVSTQTIVNIENKHFYPRWETLQKIMHVLNNA